MMGWFRMFKKKKKENKLLDGYEPQEISRDEARFRFYTVLFYNCTKFFILLGIVQLFLWVGLKCKFDVAGLYPLWVTVLFYVIVYIFLRIADKILDLCNPYRKTLAEWKADDAYNSRNIH